MDVVELDAGELVEVPVEACGEVLEPTALDVGVVKVEHRVATAEFEGARTAVAELHVGTTRVNAAVVRS